MRAVIDFPGAAERCAHAFGAPLEMLQADTLAMVGPVIARAHQRARDGAWVLGFVAYEAAPAFDRAMAVHAPLAGLPLACFGVYAAAQPLAPAAGAGFAVDGTWQARTPRPQACAGIEQIRADIARGRVYQVNLTTRLEARFGGDPAGYFAALRRAQPGGYGLFLDGGPWQLLSVSPELFFDWTAQGALSARPMKGTAARHADPVRDAQALHAMRESPKERAENLMIVDLLRNDLSRLAQPGSVRVPALFETQALPTAWQMTSTIECRTRPGVGLDDVFRALFPCGSVTGAPKIAAMASIRALEDTPRGAYCGALGVLRPGGHATFSVGIRTVMIAGTHAQCGVGSGITWDSRAADEWEEWRIKQRFLDAASPP